MIFTFNQGFSLLHPSIIWFPLNFNGYHQNLTSLPFHLEQIDRIWKGFNIYYPLKFRIFFIICK